MDRLDDDWPTPLIRPAAYGQDPVFYDLYCTLHVYRSAFAQGAPMVVLSPANTLMKYFDGGPFAGQPAPRPADVPESQP